MISILIVDDIKVNIDTLAAILGDEYVLMAAVGGEKAIKLLQRKRPDIVLLDVYMPGVDGFGVLKFMKENPELADIPVIFATGEDDSAVQEKGLALGAADYIKKPYDAALVRDKVQKFSRTKSFKT